MRDGVHLALDVYRPDGPGPFPVLYAAALHNKDMQGPDMTDVLPPQPANVPLWFGPIEAGDTRRFVANGYVHVIAQPRGSAKSEGHYGHEDTDHYDVIDWIAHQPWCDGNVGMVGISGYAGEQASRGTRPSSPQGDISVRRLQRLWRHVRISRLLSGRRSAHLSISLGCFQHGT
jgi:putative CocE/NonD family hydrolase